MRNLLNLKLTLRIAYLISIGKISEVDLPKLVQAGLEAELIEDYETYKCMIGHFKCSVT